MENNPVNEEVINALEAELKKLKSYMVMASTNASPWDTEDEEQQIQFGVDVFELYSKTDWSLGFIKNLFYELVEENVILRQQVEESKINYITLEGDPKVKENNINYINLEDDLK